MSADAPDAGPHVERAVLALVGDVIGTLELVEFRAVLLEALRRAVPCDWVSLNDLGPDPATAAFLVDPPLPDEVLEAFARLAHENPLVAYHEHTRDGAPRRLSDLMGVRELHGLRLYREVYRQIGLEHQVAFTLPHDPPRLLGVALSRSERDFDTSELQLLGRARPFLIQAYRNAVEHSSLAAELRLASEPALPAAGPPLIPALLERGLTERESEILRWIAGGRPNAAIAEALGLSTRTVEKHVQHAFAKLSVHTRGDAARIVWALADRRSARAAR